MYNKNIKKGDKAMKLIRKQFFLPEQLHDAIVKYQQDNMLPTFTAALHELVRKALKEVQK